VTLTQGQFRTLFVLGPTLACTIAPTLVFGLSLGQWGSNLIWGSVFGIGWCLAAFATGGLFYNHTAENIGLAWAWIVVAALFFLSGLIWRHSNDRQRKMVALVIALSLLVDVPGKVMLRLDQAHIHLPDFAMHLAESY
jgi:hypothetical protein